MLRKNLKDENVDKFLTLSTAYWIRVLIFSRYSGDDYVRLINRIKEEKVFFESMY